MTINALKSRLGSISARRLACLWETQPTVAKILEDVPVLIEIAEAADSLIYEEGVAESLAHFNTFQILAEALEELDEES